jgi:hypothetical protein
LVFGAQIQTSLGAAPWYIKHYATFDGIYNDRIKLFIFGTVNRFHAIVPSFEWCICDATSRRAN